MNQLSIKWNWLCHAVGIYTRTHRCTTPANLKLNKTWKMWFSARKRSQNGFECEFDGDSIIATFTPFSFLRLLPLRISLNDLIHIMMVQCTASLFRPEIMRWTKIPFFKMDGNGNDDVDGFASNIISEGSAAVQFNTQQEFGRYLPHAQTWCGRSKETRSKQKQSIKFSREWFSVMAVRKTIVNGRKI